MQRRLAVKYLLAVMNSADTPAKNRIKEKYEERIR